jgi:hypothetical protein
MTLDSITLKLAAWATNDLRVSVYYSKDPSFTLSTGTLLSADIPVTSSAFNKTKAPLSLTVNSGETVYFRFYPYSLSTSGDKYKLVGLNDISVYGKVTGVAIDPPKVTTSNASNISRSFATVAGNISDDGGSPVTFVAVLYKNMGGVKVLCDIKLDSATVNKGTPADLTTDVLTVTGENTSIYSIEAFVWNSSPPANQSLPDI